jgi:predicted MFS family arabinose efflux permease
MTITTADLLPDRPDVSTRTTFLLAVACGLIVANIYAPQPLAGPIAASLGLSPHATGLVVTVIQIGFGAGLLLLVPLGDLFETRRLTLGLIGLATLGLLGAALSPRAAPFLIALHRTWFGRSSGAGALCRASGA